MHISWYCFPKMDLKIAAIASNIALGFSMEVAVQKGIDFVQGAILHSYPLGKGDGPLNHLYRQRNLPFTPYRRPISNH